jgi:hypothetical protein
VQPLQHSNTLGAVLEGTIPNPQTRTMSPTKAPSLILGFSFEAMLVGRPYLRADRDVRPDAAAAVVAAGGRLLSLSVEQPSLEAIYTRYFRNAASQAGERHAPQGGKSHVRPCAADVSDPSARRQPPVNPSLRSAAFAWAIPRQSVIGCWRHGGSWHQSDLMIQRRSVSYQGRSGLQPGLLPNVLAKDCDTVPQESGVLELRPNGGNGS